MQPIRKKTSAPKATLAAGRPNGWPRPSARMPTDCVATVASSQAPLIPSASVGLCSRTMTAVKKEYMTTHQSTTAAPQSASARPRHPGHQQALTAEHAGAGDQGEETRAARVVGDVGEQAARREHRARDGEGGQRGIRGEVHREQHAGDRGQSQQMRRRSTRCRSPSPARSSREGARPRRRAARRAGSRS